jgi:hypothetical protein
MTETVERMNKHCGLLWGRSLDFHLYVYCINFLHSKQDWDYMYNPKKDLAKPQSKIYQKKSWPPAPLLLLG